MKKASLLILVALFIIAGCATKKPKERSVLSWGTPYTGAPETLFGKVKELKHYTYWAVVKEGKVDKGPLMSLKQRSDSGWTQDFHAFFNDSGVLTRCDYIGDNSVILRSDVTEIANGKIVKEKWSQSDTLKSIANFKFNDKGELLEVSRTAVEPDTLLFKYIIRNDEKGNPIAAKTYNTNKEVYTGRVELKRDENGRVTETCWYSAKDSLSNRMVATYNQQGFQENQKFYDKAGKLSIEVTGVYTYDEKGNWLKAVWSQSGKPYVIEERTYVYY